MKRKSPEVLVKREAKRTINVLAFMLLITSACAVIFSIAFQYIYPFLYDGAVLAAKYISGCGMMEARLIAEDLFSSLLFNAFISLIVTIVTFFIPVAIISKFVLKQQFDETVCMSGRMTLWVFPFFAAAQLLAAIFSVFSEGFATVIFPAVFTAENTGGYVAAATPETTVFDLVVYFFSLCIITPMIEEYVFRGVIFKALRKFGFVFAAVISAVMFGLVHGTAGQMAYALISGLLLAVVYEKTGNIKNCIAIHTLNNAYSFIMGDVLNVYFDADFANAVYYAGELVLTALAVFGIIALFTKTFALSKKSSETDVGEAEINSEYPEELQPGIRCMLTIGMFILAILFLNSAI